MCTPHAISKVDRTYKFDEGLFIDSGGIFLFQSAHIYLSIKNLVVKSVSDYDALTNLTN